MKRQTLALNTLWWILLSIVALIVIARVRQKEFWRSFLFFD